MYTHVPWDTFRIIRRVYMCIIRDEMMVLSRHQTPGKTRRLSTAGVWGSDLPLRSFCWPGEVIDTQEEEAWKTNNQRWFRGIY